MNTSKYSYVFLGVTWEGPPFAECLAKQSENLAEVVRNSNVFVMRIKTAGVKFNALLEPPLRTLRRDFDSLINCYGQFYQFVGQMQIYYVNVNIN